MLPKRLYLKHYLPLGLSNITELDYLVDKPIQLILGTNGSGKSSILAVASPTAPDPSAFGNGGAWGFDCSHRGSEYCLSAKFGTKNTYTFVKDDEYLLTDGNASLFNQLVEYHIGYNKKLHEILTGAIGFCQMTPAKREELLMTVSNNDFGYINSIFIKAKQSVTAAKGTLDHISNKLLDSTSKLESIRMEDGIEAHIEELRSKITELYPLSNPSADMQHAIDLMSQWEKKVIASVNQTSPVLKNVIKLKKSLGYIKQPSDIETNIDRLKDNCAEVDANIKFNLSELSKINDILSSMERFTEFGGDVETEYHSLKNKVKVLPVPHLWDAGKSSTIVSACYREYLDNPSYKCNKVFNRTEVAEAFETERLLRDELSTAKGKIAQGEEYLRHAELASIGNVTCPKCSTLILADGAITEEKIDVVKGKLAEYKKSLLDVTKQIEISNELVTEIKKFEECKAAVLSFVNRYPIVIPTFHSYSGTAEVLNSHSKVVADLFSLYNKHLEYDEMEKLKSDLAEIDEARRLRAILSDGNISDPSLYYAQLQTTLDGLYRDKDILTTELNTLTTLNKQYSMLSDLTRENIRLRSEYEQIVVNIADEMLYDSINGQLSTAQQALAISTEQLRNYKQLQERIDELEKDKTHWTEKLEVRKLLVQTLSPKQGMIGDSLISIVSAFVQRLNTIVNKVWEYPLEVIIPNDDMMDMRFTSMVNNKPGPVIQKMSSGQQDIINLAVTILVMECLDLKDFPMYLDEIGASFDFEHRRKLITFLSHLAVSGHCSMMFLIQHYISSYGSISNSDTIVLNPDNIQLPVTFNEHITIT